MSFPDARALPLARVVCSSRPEIAVAIRLVWCSDYFFSPSSSRRTVARTNCDDFSNEYFVFLKYIFLFFGVENFANTMRAVIQRVTKASVSGCYRLRLYGRCFDYDSARASCVERFFLSFSLLIAHSFAMHRVSVIIYRE